MLYLYHSPTTWFLGINYLCKTRSAFCQLLTSGIILTTAVEVQEHTILPASGIIFTTAVEVQEHTILPASGIILTSAVEVQEHTILPASGIILTTAVEVQEHTILPASGIVFTTAVEVQEHTILPASGMILINFRGGSRAHHTYHKKCISSLAGITSVSPIKVEQKISNHKMCTKCGAILTNEVSCDFMLPETSIHHQSYDVTFDSSVALLFSSQLT